MKSKSLFPLIQAGQHSPDRTNLPLQYHSIIYLMSHFYVLGASGVLGRSLVIELSKQTNFTIIPISRKEIEYSNPNSILTYFDKVETATILNCIGVVPKVAQEHPELSEFANFKLVKNIVQLLKSRSEFRFIQMSTSLVFDGHKQDPYLELDFTNPKTIYGKHKVLAEQHILNTVADQSSIYRFGSLLTSNISDTTTFNSFLTRIKSEQEIYVETGRRISIMSPSVLAQALISMLTSHRILHITHTLSTSWLEIVQYLNRHFGKRAEIKQISHSQYSSKWFGGELRPENTSLGSNIRKNQLENSWIEILQSIIDL